MSKRWASDKGDPHSSTDQRLYTFYLLLAVLKALLKMSLVTVTVLKDDSFTSVGKEKKREMSTSRCPGRYQHPARTDFPIRHSHVSIPGPSRARGIHDQIHDQSF